MKTWPPLRVSDFADVTAERLGAEADHAPGPQVQPGVPVAEQIAQADQETEQLISGHRDSTADDKAAHTLGAPLNRRSPFYLGLMAGLGLLVSYGLVHMVLELTQIITFLLVAVFLALGLEPLVARLMRRGLKRGQAVALVMLGMLGVVGLIAWIVVPTLVDQVGSLVDETPAYVTNLQHNHVVQRLDNRFHLTQQVRASATSSINEGTVSSVMGGVLGAGKALVDGAVAVVTVFVMTLYLMSALPSVKAACYKLVPQRRRVRVVFLGEEISRRVGSYVLGQASVAVINGFLTWIMLVVLGLPFPAVLAVLAGVLALVPIVGTVIGGVVITLVALSASLTTALIALGYYIAYHVFEAYVLGPRIMRRAVDVPALVTIVAVLAGGALLGVVGALIAIPVAAGLSLIYDQVLVPRQQGLTDDVRRSPSPTP